MFDVLTVLVFCRSSSDVNKLVSLLRKMKTFRDTFNSEKQEYFCQHCQYMWYGFLKRWMERQMDGWMDRWMVGWTDR